MPFPPAGGTDVLSRALAEKISAATRIPALPMQFGAERLALRTPLPIPGEHNEEILAPLGIRTSTTTH